MTTDCRAPPSWDDYDAAALVALYTRVDRSSSLYGLSGGGYRSTYLTGLDSRIRASVIVGWMTSLPTTLDIPYSVHAGLFDAFGVHANLDHPDIASLAAPDCAIFVQNCARDRLFTRSGMETAIQGVRVFRGAVGAHRKFRHRGVRAIIRGGPGDGVARPTVGAVREGIGEPAVRRVVDFRRALVARRKIR